MDRYTYYAIWSYEDNEWVGLCYQHPSLGWLEPCAQDALAGIRKLVEEVEHE